MNIQENIAALEDAIAKVKCHPMCALFSKTGNYYMVYYPAGMYPNGARVSKGMGCALALERLLEVMERHYQENTK